MPLPTWRLPPEVETGMQARPRFQNVIQESVSGTEQRVKVWAKCRLEWDLRYPILDTEDTTGTFRAVIAVVRASFGDLLPFAFKDWTDYQLTNEWIGTGDGSETVFQAIKTYDPALILLGTPGNRTYVREIYLLRPGLVVKVDGVTKTLTTDYTIGATGAITFTSPVPLDDDITLTGEFDTPVRANGDLGLTINEAHIAQIDSLPLREVIGVAELA